jgi:hypothetical protein
MVREEDEMSGAFFDYLEKLIVLFGVQGGQEYPGWTEDDLLDYMDDVWYHLSDDEVKLINTVVAEILSRELRGVVAADGLRQWMKDNLT